MGSLFRKFLPVILLFPAILPAAASGGDPLAPPDLVEYLRWGFLRVRPGLAITDFGYDDNVFYSASDPRGDTTLTVTPSLDGLLLLGSRGFVTFAESLDYTLYREFDELNSLDHSGKYRATVPFGDVGIFVDAELSRFHERPVDLQDARTIRKTRALGAGVIARLGWRTVLELEHRKDDLNYSDEDFGTLDRTIADVKNRVESAWSGRAAYSLMGRTRVTLEVEERSLSFDNPFLNSLPGVTRNLDQTTWLSGLDFGVGGALRGTLRYGYTHMDYTDPTLTDYRGIVGRTALTYILDGGTRFTLNAERRVDFSVWESNSYLLDDRRGLSATRFLNRYLGLEGRFTRGTVSVPEPAAGESRRDRFRQYSIGLLARIDENELGRKIEYALRFSDQRQDSSVPGLGQARQTITLSADVGF